MTTRQAAPSTRTPDGYEYRGYHLERCPGNQWNVYDSAAMNYPDGCMVEGARSLAEAKAEVDALVIR